MTPAPLSDMRCANPGCPRPLEAGERYCATCGLERALFRRDARWDARWEAEQERTNPKGEGQRR
jgi:ribosomal protein L37E